MKEEKNREKVIYERIKTHWHTKVASKDKKKKMFN